PNPRPILLIPGPTASTSAPNTSTEPTSGGPDPAAPNPEPSSSTPSDPVNSVKIQSRCNAIIESYRSGRLAKAAAILRIQQTIATAGPSASGNAAYKALEAYIKILDNFDAFRNSTGERGGALAGGLERAGGQLEGEREGETVEGEVLPTPKRGREVAEEDDEAEPTSRRRIDTRGFPWVIQEENSPSNLSPELRKTMAALENFARDPKLAKASLLNSPQCPQFPDSEWTNLLAGRVVDFDHVFSGLYTVVADSHSRERLGTLEVITGASAPARHVKSHSDFVIAWEKYVEACFNYSAPSPLTSTLASSTLTRLSASGSPNDATSCSQIIRPLWTSAPSGSSLEGVVQIPEPQEAAGPTAVEGRLAGGGIVGSVPIPLHLATMPISAPSAEEQDTSPMLASMLPPAAKGSNVPNRFTISHYRPRYARDFIWSEYDNDRVMLSVASESFDPLPPVPDHELNNSILSTTIASNPDLFTIVTPVRISTLRNLLDSHPNQPFVNSICDGLVHGFWPWADTADSNLPMSLDVEEYVKDPAHVKFAEEQRATEIAFRTFSPTFSALLPGMLSVPITVSTKARSKKLRLCVNHSAEPFSRNSLIPRKHVSVPLDNLHDLGSALRRARARLGPDVRLVVWKSDVKRAYRIIPMSPYWQAKQIVKINGSYNVDRNNNFGGQAGGGVWGRFFALVLWIATYMFFIEDLFAFVDDSFSWDVEGNLTLYKKYNRLLPVKQARFLSLLDLLNIPHDNEKQLWGNQLTIIGFDIDPNAMTVTMPVATRTDLISTIRDFAIPGRRLPLSSFRELAGWINWALNVYPLLRPSLCTLYEKTKGKTRADVPAAS
ncbi:hypothetical protein CVT26_002828, partial [Gymnopilus dilepis]